MSFWENVEAEREYQGISRKELAFRAHISYAGIGLGVERNSMPGADTALRVARALNVSIEYLLAEKLEKKISSEMYSQIELVRKYRELLRDMEQLQPHVREPISAMIHRLAFAERENINT